MVRIDAFCVKGPGDRGDRLDGDFAVPLVAYHYDPAQAKKLLDEAGWKAGADGIRVKEGQRLEGSTHR
jgi:ABC-type transport system substrate-binding protein